MQRFDIGKMPKSTDKKIQKIEITYRAKRAINGVQLLTLKRELSRTGKNEKPQKFTIKYVMSVLGNCMIMILWSRAIMMNMFLIFFLQLRSDIEIISL